MILILTEESDQTTNDIIDWIYFISKEQKVFRLNETDEIINIECSINSFKLHTLKGIIALEKINAYWYRRGFLNFQKNTLKEFEKIPDNLKKYRFYEWITVHDYLHFHLDNVKIRLGRFINEDKSNKLIDLKVANQVGLTIPKTVVTTLKSSLSFFERKELITKSLKSLLSFTDQELHYSIDGTKRLNDDVLKNLSNEFFLSLVQEEIKKEFEIRVFCIKSKFYAMAIFSQKNERTTLDYRDYDRENPNRNVPFNLPPIIKNKLKKFMHLRKLDSGSIDLIKTKDNKYVFLEVNPIGQFNWLSVNCNYNLEKKISEFLIEKI